MRVHRVSATAFGPFADTVTLDVDDAGRDGLFLLWGPTGAGKTSLLDAIVFALYGTVPGARGEERRLRSDHARPEVRTEVECELTLGGERLLVVRRPEQRRQKLRGAGWTTEQARLTVRRWGSAGWESVSSRIDEGSAHLRERLGLSIEQFCQVVLLPQGDFARFLRAEPEDRARLLSTLFDVDRFARAEEWLAAERTTARQALDVVRVRMSTLLARVAQVADVDVPEALAPELVGAARGAAVRPWSAEVRRQAGAAFAAARARGAETAARVAEADQDLAAARTLAERHVRRERARRELAELARQGEQLADVRAAVDAGRRAEPLRDVLEMAGRAALVHEAANGALVRAEKCWAEVAAGREATEALARQLRDQAAAARAVLPDVRRVEELAAQERRSAGAVRTLLIQVEEDETTLARWPARLTEQEVAVATAADAASRLPGLRAHRDAAAAAAEAGRVAESVAAELRRRRVSEQDARKRWLDARERLAAGRAARLDGMAAELAAQLVEGVDCPVCGAIEHPRPAPATGPVVSADDEEALRQEVEVGERRLTSARVIVEELSREFAALTATSGARSLAELVEARAASEADHSVAAASASGLDAARAEAVALVARREYDAAGLAEARARLERSRADQVASGQARAELDQRVAAARGDDPDLPGRVRRLVDEAERCESHVKAMATELRARTEFDHTRTTAQARAVDEGFPDVLAAADALLDRGRLTTLVHRVETHARSTASLQAVLADPELTDLAPPPDLEISRTACNEAAADRETAVAAVEQTRRCVEALDALAGEMTAADLELSDRRDWADQVGGLADLVAGRGANHRRMRLQSFVLAARLEQVAEVASQRLQQMSAGRYTFLHSDAQARNGARGGLGLDVLDEHTGTRRPTKTLSGGESFMASLALALGLVDVVTAESGGVALDTLFVDEGFGTLDPASLDAVMTVLDELRRGGRTVGVISHVEELKVRIPSRVEVVAARDGSRLSA